MLGIATHSSLGMTMMLMMMMMMMMNNCLIFDASCMLVRYRMPLIFNAK